MLTGYPLSCTLGRTVLGIGSGVARFLMTAEYATYRYLRCVVNVMHIFFVFTRAMWCPHTISMLLSMRAPANFSKNSRRKTSKQTFSSIPRALHPQVQGAKISLKTFFLCIGSEMLK